MGVRGVGGWDLPDSSLYYRQEIRAQHYPEMGAYTLGGRGSGGGGGGSPLFVVLQAGNLNTALPLKLGYIKTVLLLLLFASLGLRGCLVTFPKRKPNLLCLYGWCSVFSGGERLTDTAQRGLPGCHLADFVLNLHFSISHSQSPILNLHFSISDSQSPVLNLHFSISASQSPVFNFHFSVSNSQFSLLNLQFLVSTSLFPPLNLHFSVSNSQSPVLNFHFSISSF